MRILVLIHEFPPIGGGGGQVAKDICKELVKIGHEIVLITAHLKGLPREEDIDGIHVIRQPSLRRLSYMADLVAMGAFIFMSLIPALRVARSWHPDLIHVHFAVPAGALAWILSRLTGIPYVLTAHLGDIPGGVPDKTEDWFRWFYPFTPVIWRDAAQVVAVSQFTRSLAVQCYPVDVQVIPNGVNLGKLDPGTIRVGEPPQIVFAGRFVPQKNPLQLVNVLSELTDLPWKCVMIGDGPLRGDVECLIQQKGLQDRFTLPGWLYPDEVLAWFSRSDLLFHPSLSEGLPVVGIQAMAMGLAIVASRVGGFAEIVEQGKNGYLFPPEDGGGMQSGLRTLLGNPQALADARIQSRLLAARFDLNLVVRDYLNIMNKVVAG
jgi:glycosyltransferase involved in cell wall biosynthesis